jgi:hypothetical protein
MNRRAYAGLLLVVAALCARPAFAGTISLNTSVSSSVKDDTLRVTIKIENRGTDAASNGHAEIAVQGQRILTDRVAEFNVGKPVVFTEEVKLDAQIPGAYPLIVTIFYTDGNQYPFSAIASHVFSWRATNVVSDIVGGIKPMTISKRGKAEVTLKNVGSEDVVAATRLVFPRELTADGEAVAVTLPGRSERKIKFAMENFSATGGSTYPLVAVSEFDRDGMHYTSIASGSIQCVDRTVLMGLNYYVLGGILAVLVLAFVIFQKRKT